MTKQERADRRLFYQRAAMILAADIISMTVVYFAALWIRFDFQANTIPKEHIVGLTRFLPVAVLLTILIYFILHLYQSVWSFASVTEASRIMKAYAAIGLILVLFNKFPRQRIPWSVLCMGYIMSGVCCVGIRFSYRFMRYLTHETAWRRNNVNTENVLLIGAGQAAREILKDIFLGGHADLNICAIVDDKPSKRGKYLEGVRIEGSRRDIPDLVRKYKIKRIIFAIPSARPEDRRDILNICKETGCRLQTVPGLYQLLEGEVSITKLRDVDPIDLLGREEIRVNNEEIYDIIEGKTVLVTGGGGSIGSELCRQIARANPKRLIVFDIYENNAYDIQQELKKTYPVLELETVIGSVRNTNRVNSLMETYRPDIVFHAAAHKHVPLMEDSPNEAVKNNVMGTWKVARAAAKAGVGRMILISTDKAVNPTNIMGASKRICEMIIQMMSRKCPETVFSAVRFGNVLGSNGSVIPLFKKQIEAGGPVTVTDPNIIRYFMTIPEAVSLVMQACCYARGGEIFVLDMGQPVRIDDMARNLIKLSGYKPDVDIKIVYTGLRPGEKLYEELLMDEEGLERTENDLIYVGKPIEMDDEQFLVQLRQLDELSRAESDGIRDLVRKVVPTYHEAEQEKEEQAAG